MEKRTLGKTGIEVGVLGLGGVFVSSIGSDAREGERTIKRALELGVTYIDTAPTYADSEAVIGRALTDLPSRRVPTIATKLGGWPVPFDPKDRDALHSSFRASLTNLGLPRVGGLMVHEPDRPGLFDWWDDDVSADGPVIDVLSQLKADGLISFTGIGGTTAYELAARAATGRFDVVLTTFNYSLLWREATHSVFPAAKQHDMGIIVGAPLQQGALATRYDTELETATWISPPRRDQYRQLYAFLDDVGLPIHEASLRWVISNPDVSCVVVGARSVAEIEANVEAVSKGALPDDVIAELDRIAALVPFRPFEEPGGAFGLPFRRDYRGPGPLFGTGAVGGIDKAIER